MKHKKSILQKKDGRCYLCMKLNDDYSIKKDLQEHHIYGGPNRARSEEEGLKVYLCMEHHTAGEEAVHLNNRNMRLLQREGQKAYEKAHTRQEFMNLIGRNYLEEDGRCQT